MEDSLPDEDAILALAPRGNPARMKLAASLAHAQRDEFVYVGRKGEVRAPWRYRAQQTAAMGLALAAGGVGAAVCVAAGLPLLSAAYIGVLAYTAHVWMASNRLKRGAALLAAEELEPAEATLQSLVRSRWTPRSLKALAWQNLAGVAARRGDHEAALRHTVQCREALRKLRLTPVGPWRWINRFSEAQLLAQLGRLAEARALRTELESAPDGEYFKVLTINTHLLIAFEAEDTRELPRDLFPWARIALETTTAELALALVAWAYFQRGDSDMGAHLLEEARSRIEPALFGRTYPRVYAWLQQAR